MGQLILRNEAPSSLLPGSLDVGLLWGLQRQLARLIENVGFYWGSSSWRALLSSWRDEPQDAYRMVLRVLPPRLNLLGASMVAKVFESLHRLS